MTTGRTDRFTQHRDPHSGAAADVDDLGSPPERVADRNTGAEEGPEHRAATGTRHSRGTRGWALRRNAREPEHAPDYELDGTERWDDEASERNDDDELGTAEATHHHIVVPVADRNDEGSARNDDRAGEDVPADLLTGTVRQWFDVPQFWCAKVGSLQDLLRFARKAPYNMSHIAVVRSANLAFFWLVSVLILTPLRFLEWAFFVRLHRALTATVLTLTLAPVLRTVPIIGWPIPDWLVVTSWSPTTWRTVGVALLVFTAATAIAYAGERRR